MRILNFIKRCANLTVPFRLLLPVSIMLIALSVASCKSPGRLTQDVRSTDSLESRKEFALLQEPVPPSMAKTTFPTAMLNSIPIGTGFSKRSGQATVNVNRISADSTEVTATCDSLARQVIVLTEELTRIRNETQKETETLLPQVVREPTGWQWFQIWTGRLAVAAFLLLLIKRRLKTNKI